MAKRLHMQIKRYKKDSGRELLLSNVTTWNRAWGRGWHLANPRKWHSSKRQDTKSLIKRYGTMRTQRIEAEHIAERKGTNKSKYRMQVARFWQQNNERDAVKGKIVSADSRSWKDTMYQGGTELQGAKALRETVVVVTSLWLYNQRIRGAIIHKNTQRHKINTQILA